MIFVCIHSFFIGDWCKKALRSRVLEYQGKTENILENNFCIKTVWRLKIFDILHYSTKISCQVHLNMYFRVSFEVHSGAFRSILVSKRTLHTPQLCSDYNRL